MSADLALLARVALIDTTSLADAGPALRVLPREIRPVATGKRMLGRARTALAEDDLMSVLAALHDGAAGEVLVVATGGAERAVAGELFAAEATRRQMAGIVIDGLCRDTATLARLALPVFARGASPRASPAAALPVVQVPLRIGDVEVRPGDIVIGDDDGIIVATEEELAAAIDAAEAIQRREAALWPAIEGGVSLFDRLDYAEHRARLEQGLPSRLSFHDGTGKR